MTTADSVSAAAQALTRRLGDVLTTDPDAMLAYVRDQSMLTQAGLPIAVVRARDIDDVIATLQIASDTRTPVVTRGAGTGLAGAANAINGCIVLSVARMNRILEIDPAAQTATVEPGVINADLAAEAAKHGLWYVPDPASRAISSIGGNLATNAGGACCAKYGVTGDHVARIKAVLPDGRIIHTGASTRKNVAGLDLTHLLVGSEGTLAVIVEATMRLRAQPKAAATVVAFFANVEAAVDASLEACRAAEPSLVELMDRTTIAAVNEMTRMGLDETAGAMLLLQCDGPAATAEATACAAVFQAGGAIEVVHTDDPDEGDAFMEARRAALTALERQGTVLLDDIAVPVPMLPRMMLAIQSAATRHAVQIGTFGHAADGNLHPTIIFDASQEGVRARAQAAFEDIVAEAMRLGGTISGEHGIGVLKRPFMQDMVGRTESELMAGIKSIFDPTMILNPGRGF